MSNPSENKLLRDELARAIAEIKRGNSVAEQFKIQNEQLRIKYEQLEIQNEQLRADLKQWKAHLIL